MKKSEQKIEREKPRPKVRSRAPRVSIIGAGRMGIALGRAFHRFGYPIDLVVTKHEASARRAAKSIKGEAVTSSMLLRSESARERLLGSNLLLISTPDDALEPVARQLATLLKSKTRGRNRTRRIALHTSGALSSEVLAPLRTAGFAVASMHPLVSIADANSPEKLFQGTYFCVEGDQVAVRAARSIVGKLGGSSFTIDPKSKALYHAAAVMSAGHVVALFDLAVELLQRCGLPKPRARAVLLPLIESTAANLALKDPARALTGPFSRGDSKTAAKHLAALKSAGDDLALQVYVALGRRSLDLTKATQRSSKTFGEISRLLSRARKQT